MTKNDLFSGKRFMLDCFTPAIAIGPGGFRSSETMPLMVGDSQIGSVEELVFHPIDTLLPGGIRANGFCQILITCLRNIQKMTGVTNGARRLKKL